VYSNTAIADPKDMAVFWSYFSAEQVSSGDRIHARVWDQGFSGNQAITMYTVNYGSALTKAAVVALVFTTGPLPANTLITAVGNN
jgi:deoxycytidine triphosphate deaminase